MQQSHQATLDPSAALSAISGTLSFQTPFHTPNGRTGRSWQKSHYELIESLKKYVRSRWRERKRERERERERERLPLPREKSWGEGQLKGWVSSTGRSQNFPVGLRHLRRRARTRNSKKRSGFFYKLQTLGNSMQNLVMGAPAPRRAYIPYKTAKNTRSQKTSTNRSKF